MIHNINQFQHDRPLDSKLALSLIDKELYPNDVIISNKNFITRIGNLSDVTNIIKKLNISFNSIKTLDGIDQLPQLKILLAYSCDLDNISNINKNLKLEILYLQHNNICKIIDSFQSLIKLQELRLDHNAISKIENLTYCVQLKKIDLSYNNIETISGKS
jgi:Leucine-rich repeat (LRR) protein